VVAVTARSWTRLNNNILIAGLGFGDEGKGTITDFLAAERDCKLVVRYNGGSQAAHNVVMPDGRHHTFSNFGSGSFRGARTFLSRFVLISPESLAHEAAGLSQTLGRNAWELVTIDEDAVIITPYHRALNRLRELARGDARHGSVGIGLGEARGDAIAGKLTLRARDLLAPELNFKLAAIQTLKWGEAQALPTWRDDYTWDVFRQNPFELANEYHKIAKQVEIVPRSWLANNLKGHVIFEGAQGVLLDETHGFHPYVTWTDTTYNNALTLLQEAGASGSVERVGVTRSFSTRHGAGPLVPEVSNSKLVEGDHNHVATPNPFTGQLRAGPLDLVALRYAVDALDAFGGGTPDYVAVTHLDKYPGRMCKAYDFGMFHVGRLTPLHPNVSLEERKRMTAFLATARADFQGMDTQQTTEPLAEFLSDELNDLDISATLFSKGPTAADKFYI
jgi:adenylosuccinate synthase